jgi:hypothetical protein
VGSVEEGWWTHLEAEAEEVAVVAAVGLAAVAVVLAAVVVVERQAETVELRAVGGHRFLERS